MVTWLLDCDGVVWLADEVIPGAPEAVAMLRSRGTRVVFLTNNSYPRLSDHMAKLARLGMATAPEDLLSSSMATATLLKPGERALVLGGPGVLEQLEARGVTVLRPKGEDPGSVDVVVVGMDPSFDYQSLSAATRALHGGARLVATNDDATFPSPGAVLPGAGSLVAAVARAGQSEPTIAGKPYWPTVELVRDKIGAVEMVVGDRPSTDGLLARQLEVRFGLVLTGVTPPGHGPLDPEPAIEGQNLLDLVRREVG